jgi:hypothetical protein
MSEETPDPPGQVEHRHGASAIPTQQVSRIHASDRLAQAESSTTSDRPTVGQLLLALLVALVVTAIWRRVLPLSVPRCCDARVYLTMAADPTHAVKSPYSSRIFLPWLTHLLGGPPKLTFDRISLACMVATGPLVYTVTRRLGAVHWAALLAMVGLLSSRAWVFYLYDPWLTDPAAMLLVAAAFLAIVSGRVWVVALVGIVFAGVRELYIGLAAPAFGWLRGRLGTLRAALTAGLLVLPGWLAYQWIVRTVPSKDVPGGRGFKSQTIFGLGSWFADRGGVGYLLVVAVVLSFGCWWVLAVPSLGDDRVRPLLWWLVPVFGQFLFGGDWGRFVLYAFPVVIPAAALTLQRLRPRVRAVVLAILGLQLLTPLLDIAPAERMRLNSPGPSVPVTAALMAATVVVLVAFSVAGRRGRRERVTASSHEDERVVRGRPSR